MTDITAALPGSLRRIDRVWTLVALLPILIWAFLPDAADELIGTAADAFVGTLPMIVFAVLAVALLKATGAEAVVAKAFIGSPARMITLAAMAGGLAPFCSCEVIPFIAAMLAMGVPLGAVMAFWLSSPLMDPAMFLITAGALGTEFAVAKTLSAVGLGLFGGAVTHILAERSIFPAPLKEAARGGCGCGPSPFEGTPNWTFWAEPERRSVFLDTALRNALFLGKWLALAYLLEALMIEYVPASWIATAVGGGGLSTIAVGALVGMPAYLNGYAAVALIDGLTTQGMSQGAAMSFMLAGGVSSIPAAMAVWPLVKPRVFAAYLGLALVGSIAAGFVWQSVA